MHVQKKTNKTLRGHTKFRLPNCACESGWRAHSTRARRERKSCVPHVSACACVCVYIISSLLISRQHRCYFQQTIETSAPRLSHQTASCLFPAHANIDLQHAALVRAVLMHAQIVEPAGVRQFLAENSCTQSGESPIATKVRSGQSVRRHVRRPHRRARRPIEFKP